MANKVLFEKSGWITLFNIIILLSCMLTMIGYSKVVSAETKSFILSKDEEIESLKETIEVQKNIISKLKEEAIDLKVAKPKNSAVDINQMRKVIKGTLIYLGIYSKDFEELLIFTASVESEMGRYIHQKGGPALGAFQILPSTEKDIVDRWLKFPKNSKLQEKVLALKACPIKKVPQLMTDYRYQVAIAACVYLKTGKKIPSHKDVIAMSRFYKRYYNTNEPEKIAVSLKRYKRVLAENER